MKKRRARVAYYEFPEDMYRAWFYARSADWKNVDAWRARLSRTKNKRLAALEGFFQRAVPDEAERAALRTADMQHAGEYPLEAMFNLIEQGRAVPPELLLGALDAFNSYLDAAGALSLEEAFFNKPRKRTGNLARRRSESRSLELDLAIRYVEHAEFAGRPGSASEHAAEAIKRFGLKITPESLLRIVRRERVARAAAAAAWMARPADK